LLLPCGRSVGDRGCEAVELCVKCNMRNSSGFYEACVASIADGEAA